MSPTSVDADSPHQSLTRIEWLTFSGKPGEDVLLFVRAVTRFALYLDRERDSEWMATYMYGCLKEEALKWYETLDPEIRGEWSGFRELLIAKFKTPDVLLCRMKVLSSKNEKLGYVGYINGAPDTTIEESVTEAMVVYMPLVPPQDGITLRYVARPGIDKAEYPFVGVAQMDSLCALRVVDGGNPTANGYPDAAQTSQAYIWFLRENDDGTEELTMQWYYTGDGKFSPLIFVTRTEGINDPKSEKRLWVRRPPGHLHGEYEPVKLVLERL